MMELKVFLFALFITESLAETHKVPQVYEESEDPVHDESKESGRVIRDPTLLQLRTHQKYYRPPIFNFQSAFQQDKRKHRYAEQQRADIKNIIISAAPYVHQSLQNHDISKLRDLHRDTGNKKEQAQSIWTNIFPVKRSARVSRKLRPNSYYEELTQHGAADILRRQDHNSHLVYVDPARFNMSPQQEQELSALNALIGKNPNIQLQGLKKLLGEQPHLDSNKDHIPITEQTVDVPNNQNRPNIRIEHNPSGGELNLQDLQAQLDEVTKTHTNQVLAQAQFEAEAHVKAQNDALARVQADVQREALAKIAAHNHQAKFRTNPDVQQQEDRRFEASPLNTEGDYYIPTPQALIQAVQVQAESEALLRAQAEQTQTLGHIHQPDAKRTKLKRISITNSHSITQAHHHPSGHQKVVRTQNINQVHPVEVHQHDSNNHQYAARYAFGYRIRDVKMGNDFGHEEQREGHTAKGHYHVLLPDGRLQKVEYYADPTGYHAKVTYENIAHH